MERVEAQTVDQNLIEHNGVVISSYDLDRCIDNYVSTLKNPDDINNKNTKAFNGLLLYIYRNLIRYILPNSYNNDYELLDIIFHDIYINLCYMYNHTPTISNFCILTGLKYSVFYDIKNGVYRANNGVVNDKHKRIIQNWIDICNGELLDNIIHTNSIGSMFLAKVHGFREDNITQVNLTVNVPTISEKQLNAIAGSDYPTLPDTEN